MEVTQVSSPQFLLPLKRVIIVPANPFQRSMGDLMISLLRIISSFVSMAFKIKKDHDPHFILGIVSLVYWHLRHWEGTSYGGNFVIV